MLKDIRNTNFKVSHSLFGWKENEVNKVHIVHCVALHTLSGITQKVSTVKLLHRKVSIFCIHFGKIFTGQKKITRAPPVVPVTNMRYDDKTPLKKIKYGEL